MEKDEQGYVEIQLTQVGMSNRTGVVYPEGVLQMALDKFKLRHPGKLHGEHNQQSIFNESKAENGMQRMGSILYENVSHLIDTDSLRIENGFVVGKLKADGPKAELFEKFAKENNVHVALRGTCNYKEPVDGVREVENLDIITFDLTDKPLF